MYKNLVLLSFIIMLCSACATPKPAKPYNVNKNEATLAEASYSVSRSLVDLAETEQAASNLPEIEPPPSPASYGMDGLTSVDWSGPIEPIVRQIAKAADYRVRVVGTRPAIPVLVTVYQKNAMLGDILRDIGYQGGQRAAVLVFPGSRVIEIRYAKN